MTRTITLLGYALVAVAAAALELVARRSGRVATLGQALAAARRWWPLRAVLLAGWLWLGWHLFVRVDWS
jgi:hypothetical protein